jgi:hypothetical protein
MSSEFRDAQPRTLPTASPTPTPAPTTALLTVAQPTEADFYSSYNQPGTSGEGSGVGTLCLTRIWLDTTGSAAQKTLYWQRRPVSSPFTGSWEDSGVRKVKLATNVVNNSVANAIAGTSYTAIFTYAYRDATSGNVVWTDTVGTAALDKIIAVRLRLIVDANLSHAPKYIDLTTTVRPRNASGS